MKKIVLLITFTVSVFAYSQPACQWAHEELDQAIEGLSYLYDDSSQEDVKSAAQAVSDAQEDVLNYCTN